MLQSANQAKDNVGETVRLSSGVSLLTRSLALSRTPQDGVLGELGLTVLEGVLCERVSNGVASIHPGPVRGYRLNAAGMMVYPRGPVAGSAQNCASSAGKQDD